MCMHVCAYAVVRTYVRSEYVCVCVVVSDTSACVLVYIHSMYAAASGLKQLTNYAYYPWLAQVQKGISLRVPVDVPPLPPAPTKNVFI